MEKSLIRYFTCLCALVLAGCGGPSDNGAFDHLVFRYNESANITSLDPAFSRIQSNIWACNQIFNGLVQLDDSLNVQPDLAASWQISADGLEYRFQMRKGVYFHKSRAFGPDSTRAVTAADVAYSFDRLLDEAVASPGRWILQNVASYRAANDSVFEVSLKKPFPPFLGLLAMKYASVVPREGVEAGDFHKKPIGTGPFAFKLWEENVKLVLRKNPGYYEKDENGKQLPYLEAVAISFLPDKQSGFLEFVQGKNDFISGLDPSYKDEILTQKGTLQSKYASSVKMLTGPYLNTEYLGFRLDGPSDAAKDKRIRQALNHGFDREKLVLYLRNNMGIAGSGGLIPEGLPGSARTEYYAYDVRKARELVSEYESETGRAAQITLSMNPAYVDIAEYLQREWQKVGISVAIDMGPPSALRTAMVSGKVGFFRASWIADYPDAENYLSLFYSPNFTPNGPNYTHFKSDTFDALYERAFLETDAQKRAAHYRLMDSLAMAEAPVVVLFYDKAARFTRQNVHGLGINPLNMLHLKRVYKTK